MMEVSRYEQLTDIATAQKDRSDVPFLEGGDYKLCAHYYELPKIPRELDKDDLLLLWLSLFGAKTKEELEEIEALEVPVMREAIGAYHNVSGSTEFQRMEQFRADAKRNEAAALRNAERRGEARGEKIGEKKAKIATAQNLLRLGLLAATVAEATGLERDEVENLRDAD